MDGGMGTLALKQLAPNAPKSLWGSALLLQPGGFEANTALHASYLRAGAELIIANTHNASLTSFIRALGVDGHPLTALGQMAELNRAAVQSARLAARRHATFAKPRWVAAGVMGPDTPYGLAPTMDAAQAKTRMQLQVDILVRAGIDLLIFEMLNTEAEIEAAASLGAQSPVPWAAAFVPGQAGRSTWAGVPIQAAITAFGRPPDLFFVHCCAPSVVGTALDQLPPGRRGAYPNRGGLGPVAFARAARSWSRRDLAVMGSCCDTGPEHTSALARSRSPDPVEFVMG